MEEVFNLIISQKFEKHKKYKIPWRVDDNGMEGSISLLQTYSHRKVDEREKR
jgi:hypothetical protein